MLVCNEQEDKVYIGGRPNSSPQGDSVYVLDCAGDSVRAVVALNSNGVMGSVTLAPWSNRVYCLSSSISTGTVVYVLDCATDSIVGRTPIQLHYGVGTLAAHPDNHRIYLAAYWEACVYVFRDEPSGVTEPVSAKVPRVPQTWVWPNPASDWLMLEGTGEAELFCPDGRPVLALAPGRNDVRSLPAGVYFIRRAGRGEPCSMVKLKQ
jgi:hypothetical protein